MRMKYEWSRAARVVRNAGLVCLVYLLMGAFSASADEFKIGFVDLQKALTATSEWKKQSGAFKEEFDREQKIISAKESRITKMLEDLNKQGMVLDPELKREKENEFRNERRDFERYVKDKTDEFSNREKQMTADLLKKMVEVIQKLGKELKFTMILEQKALMYFDSAKDLTPLAIKAYDRTYK
ncbi:MAG: molecular chaperone Skp [Nitrospinae bacterium CG11_big_fil_rev_8_21_14_0_20_56_8]|nr:MAG: molecular chaperone Skp [Nitrospinae bacterium CG11_big_fil_rev_8_21_14_0_20_56_8]